jgi:hypothetical protein
MRKLNELECMHCTTDKKPAEYLSCESQVLCAEHATAAAVDCITYGRCDECVKFIKSILIGGVE